MWRNVIGTPAIAMLVAAAALCIAYPAAPAMASGEVRYFDIPTGLGPHDVAPSPQAGGPVYFTAQRAGKLGILTPADGKVALIDLGRGSAPHGVIIGPDGAPWVTDGGLNAVVRVDPTTHAVRSWPVPTGGDNANLNTASFDRAGRIWFTGQSGYYGRLDPASGNIEAWKAPRGFGPYGITTTPAGEVYYASLAGNYLGHIDTGSGAAAVIEPPTPQQGARRVVADSRGRVWVSYWSAGKVACYDPAANSWREWPLPGSAHAYAVWLDDRERVWLSDWTANALVMFDPRTEKFEKIVSDRSAAHVRQIAARGGEIWAAESGNDRLVMVTTK